MSRSIFLGQPAVDGNWSYSGTTAITSDIAGVSLKEKVYTGAVAITSVVLAGKSKSKVYTPVAIAITSVVAGTYIKASSRAYVGSVAITSGVSSNSLKVKVYTGGVGVTSTIPTLWNRVKNTISTVATNTVVAGKWARGVALSVLIATQSGVATSYNKTKNFVANTTATIVTSISGFFGFTPVTTGVGVSLKYNRINLRIGIGF